ncbi:WD repeat-containing protein 97 [Stegostoma tigrinum]|uniref:WD repeat-containing protein 97 n=1 Tax=Stegostoma tigrinum TaxID=3053191 RepID=UPI0028704DD6|nr:WD repeat-containing protein 97 [Stegostoma tigrinum]
MQTMNAILDEESEDDNLSQQPEMELETTDTQETLQDSLQDSFLKTTEEKVQRLWHVLRTAVYESAEKIRRHDWKPMDLEHGLQHVQRVIFKNAIHHVLYNGVTKKFICLKSKTSICIYHCDGRKKQEYTLRGAIEGIVYARQINRYVAWNICPQVKVLGPDFQVISTNRSKQTITCCQYNEDLNEIVTAGVGNVCTWHFYFGCRELICASTITIGLSQEDVFTELALERVRGTTVTMLRSQHCYAVCGKGVAVFDLLKATVISYEKRLHDRVITGIILFETPRRVVTSSRDGNIKIWDENWNLQIMFVGHRGPITALALYPHGPYLLSGSEDETIRAWSLELADQVDEIQMGVTVTRLGTELGEDSIFSCANQRLDFWTITHLYRQHTAIGHSITAIQNRSGWFPGRFPVRSACSCADGTVRLICPDTGEIITSLLLGRGQRVADFDYCLPREALLVLTKRGDLLKANALANPMETQWEVLASGQMSQLCCLCIYAHTVDKELTYSRWLEAVARGSEGKIQILGVKDNDRFLPIAGHQNGFLSVLDWRSGSTQYQVHAHESGKLSRLAANPANQQLISSGEDNAIKIWRVFPYAQESLSLLMNLYGAHPTTHLCIMKTMFMVAFQNPVCAVHTLVLYDIRKKARKDHHPANDHEAEITGLCACPELKIFASTCKAGIVKIWDHNNQLIRVLHLKAVANSISFCNDVGNIFLGIERNLYVMNSSEYLPQQYLLRIACRDVSDPVPDAAIPITSATLNSLSAEDSQRLRGPHAFNSPEHSVVLPVESDVGSLEKQDRLKEAYASLAMRDEEILLIQRGEMRGRKKPPRTKEILQQGFRKYMQLLYAETPHIEIPEIPIYDPNERLVDLKSLLNRPHRCSNIVRGFFPPVARPEPWSEVTAKEKKQRGLSSSGPAPIIPIALDGYIPNSVILRLLWPLDLFEIVDSEPDSMVDSEVDLTLDVTAPTVEPRVLQDFEVSDTLTRHSSIFLEKVELLEEENRKAKQHLGQSALITAPSGQKVRKLSSTAVLRNELLARRRSSQLSKGTASSPLPAFVTLFKGTSWFDSVFPEPDSTIFPPELTETAFAEMLIMTLATVDYNVKEGIVKALVFLLQCHPSNVTAVAHDALITALNGSSPPDQKIQLQENFIRTALWALKELTPNSEELLVELMVQYLQSGILLRNNIMLLLVDIGLLDPHNFFETEMNSWIAFDEAVTSNKQNLQHLSSAWLKKWTRKFKEHVQTALKSLKKGKTLRGTIPAPRNPPPSEIPAALLKKVDPDQTTMIRIPEGVQPGSLEQLHPIEAVNYFCELQLQQKLKAMTATENEKAAKSQRDREMMKNTVLFLPKIQRERALLRLGETTVTGKQLEKLHLPPIISGPLTFDIGRFIKLAVPKVNLNPFPSAIDNYPVQHVLITLRHSPQKYFILERSYVSNYS